MHRKLKRLLFCCVLLLSCADFARASFQEPDSSSVEAGRLYDSQEMSGEEPLDTSYVEDTYEEETLPPRTVIYNEHTPTERRWLEASSDDAYTYRTKREYVERQQEKPRSDPWLLQLILVFLSFFSTTAGKLILWGLLIVLVGFIIYRLVIGRGLFAKRDIRVDEPVEQPGLSEEGLMELNWQLRMREALAAGKQRDAIRYGYLHLLQQLQAQELIRFRQDKTNIAYYRELPEAYRPAFRNITRSYEFAWYGGFMPDAAGMEDYLKQLEAFLGSIPKL